jgi:DNA-binding transcriptional ArsR family regulator
MDNPNKLMDLFKKSLPFLSAIGDPTRQQLIVLISSSERLSVKELTAHTDLSRPTISHHLKVLMDAQIVVANKVGREIYYTLQPGEYFYVVEELVREVNKAVNKEKN